jgi:hypothetical protein
MLERKYGNLCLVDAEKGQSLVELVIVLPLLLLFLAGVFDVGRAMQTYVVMVNASREAALRGAAGETDTNTLRLIALNELARNDLDPGQATVTVTYQVLGFPPEDHIIVEVDYILPMLLSVLSFDSITLSSRTEMVTFW